MYKLVSAADKDSVALMEEFNQSHPKGHFAQSFLWAAVKDNWQNSAVLSLDGEGRVRGAMLLLFRKLPLGLSIMYSPRGPVCDVHDREVLKDLFDGARALAKKHGSYVFKIDPDVLSSDEEFVSLMRDFGFRLPEDSKNFEGIQPRYVFRLPVAGKSEEDLLAGFESKTRYNLRLSVRKGVTVKFFPGDGDVPEEELDAFSRLMETTGERDRFIVRGKEYFRKLLKVMGSHARLYMAYADGERIAGTVAVQYGDKVWYLYGASANEKRNLMPNYQLQWEMIRWSLEAGCRIYDFRGVSGDLSEDNPLYGLYRFKKGFNGDFCEFAGEFDLEYGKLTARVMNFAEKVFRRLRYRKRMGKESGNG